MLVEEMSDSFLVMSPDFGQDKSDDLIELSDIFKQIDEAFLSSSIVVLNGQSGIGKSFIASEYGHANSNFTVRWFTSQTFELLYQNYIQKLIVEFFPGSFDLLKEKNNDIKLKLINKKYEMIENNLLFIFDNLNASNNDDLIELIKLITRDLPSNVKTLITTNSHLNQTDGLFKNVINLNLFDRKQAEQLVELKTSLAISLDNENTFLQINVVKLCSYIKYFNKQQLDDGKLDIIDNLLNELFEDLSSKNANSFELLKLASFLDSGFISYDLISNISDLNEEQIREGVAYLKDLFIFKDKLKCDGHDEGFRMHPETQKSTRSYINSKLDDETKFKLYNRILDYFYEQVRYTCLDIDFSLINKLQHVKSLLEFFTDLAGKSEDILKKEAELESLLANFFENCFVCYNLAIEHNKRALGLFQQVYKNNHESVANVLHNTGVCYLNSSNFNEAIESLNESMEIKYKLYDQSSLSMGQTYHFLGLCYKNIAEHKKAIKYYDFALDVYKKNYDEYDAIIADELNTIGLIYRTMGEYNESNEYLNKALDVYRNVYEDEENFSISSVYKNIGLNYMDAGDAYKSTEYLNKTLEISMKILDANHPDLARILNYIGLNFQNSGDYFNSVGYFTRAIYIFATLKNDTVEQRNEVALVFCSLATSYQYLADFIKSNECLYQALTIYNGVCSIVKNEETEGSLADTYSHIAINYLNLHDYKKSIEYFETSLEIYKRIYDETNLSIAQTLNNIGTGYQLLAEYEKSIEYFERSVEVFKGLYGDPAHPSVAAGMINVENSRKMMESLKVSEREQAEEQDSFEIIINPLKSIMNFFIRALSIFKLSR